MTPKICVILATDEDGNQKYVELTQQQALAYNAGALPIIQVRLQWVSENRTSLDFGQLGLVWISNILMVPSVQNPAKLNCFNINNNTFRHYTKLSYFQTKVKIWDC